MAVPARVVRMGNSRGIRIPKALLEQTGLPEDVELEVAGQTLIVRPRGARAGWEEAFAELGPDAQVWPDASTTQFDDAEWRWP